VNSSFYYADGGSVSLWWNNLLTALNQYDSIALLTHKDPDGDGLAALLALQAWLASQNKQAQIVLEETAPALYDFLFAAQHSIVMQADLHFDLLIVLDCHELGRLGKCAPLTATAQQIFVMDHHEIVQIIPSAQAWIDPLAVSVGVMLHSCLKSEIIKADADLQLYYADCIYTTILNDTDNFLNANTDVAAFQTAAELLPMGLKAHELAMQFLYCKPVNELQFVGEVLASMESFNDGRILFMYSDRAMLQKHHLVA
jgi:phosphoesterase RecJ-like protein